VPPFLLVVVLLIPFVSFLLQTTDAVAFEVCSFSWPQHPLARLTQPIVHAQQRKAAEAFCLRMQEVARERVFEVVNGKMVETSGGKGVEAEYWPE
jgi:hypothetical protein